MRSILRKQMRLQKSVDCPKKIILTGVDTPNQQVCFVVQGVKSINKIVDLVQYHVLKL